MEKATKTSWLMFILGIIIIIVCAIMNVMPAPLATTIMAQTGWDVGAVGKFVSVISLMVGIFCFVGSSLQDRLGIKLTAFIGMAFACIGGILHFFAGDSYTLNFLGRFLFGAGKGICVNVPAAIIPLWFPKKIQPALQGLRTGLTYIGLAMTYYIVMPIFNATQSWQSTFGIFGIVAGVTAVIFLLFAKDKKPSNGAAANDKTGKNKAVSGIKQAMKSKVIWWLLFSQLSVAWMYNTYSAYLPTYLKLERGFTVAQASSLSGIMPLVGAVAGIVCGLICSASGRTKLIGWPNFIIGICGVLLTLYGQGFMMAVGIGMFGFCAAGFTTMWSTVPAQLPESNPAFYGGSMAMILGFSFIPCYFIPYIVKALYKNGAGMTMGHIFLIFTIFLVVGMIPQFFLKETGPKGKKAVVESSAE